MASHNSIKSVTARANVNIALLKYWGKKDETLKIPHQSSISLTLDDLYTVSTLSLFPNACRDELWINGEEASESDRNKLSEYFDLVRKIYHINGFIHVDSHNHVPTGAGLASSASSYASIALALNELFNMGLDKIGLSRLARLGSGSASRSIFGGFTVWHHGDNHDSSFAEALDTNWDDLAFIVVILSKDKKKISSREAMKKSLSTSEYLHFVKRSEELYPLFLDAIKDKSIERLGPLVEESSNLLHQTIRSSGIDYYLRETYELLDFLKQIKADFPLFYTIDAGPNVKLLTSKQYLKDILNRLSSYHTLVSYIGKDAYVQTKNTW